MAPFKSRGRRPARRRRAPRFRFRAARSLRAREEAERGESGRARGAAAAREKKEPAAAVAAAAARTGIVALVALQLDDLAHLLVLFDGPVAVKHALHRLANALQVQVGLQALRGARKRERL